MCSDSEQSPNVIRNRQKSWRKQLSVECAKLSASISGCLALTVYAQESANSILTWSLAVGGALLQSVPLSIFAFNVKDALWKRYRRTRFSMVSADELLNNSGKAWRYIKDYPADAESPLNEWAIRAVAVILEKQEVHEAGNPEAFRAWIRALEKELRFGELPLPKRPDVIAERLSRALTINLIRACEHDSAQINRAIQCARILRAFLDAFRPSCKNGTEHLHYTSLATNIVQALRQGVWRRHNEQDVLGAELTTVLTGLLTSTLAPNPASSTRQGGIAAPLVKQEELMQFVEQAGSAMWPDPSISFDRWENRWCKVMVSAMSHLSGAPKAIFLASGIENVCQHIRFHSIGVLNRSEGSFGTLTEHLKTTLQQSLLVDWDALGGDQNRALVRMQSRLSEVFPVLELVRKLGHDSAADFCDSEAKRLSDRLARYIDASSTGQQDVDDEKELPLDVTPSAGEPIDAQPDDLPKEDEDRKVSEE